MQVFEESVGLSIRLEKEHGQLVHSVSPGNPPSRNRAGDEQCNDGPGGPMNAAGEQEIQCHKEEAGSILGVSAAFYSAGNAITPLFFGSLFQWFGPPVPFLAGGVLLAVLWLIAVRKVPASQPA